MAPPLPSLARVFHNCRVLLPDCIFHNTVRAIVNNGSSVAHGRGDAQFSLLIVREEQSAFSELDLALRSKISSFRLFPRTCSGNR